MPEPQLAHNARPAPGSEGAALLTCLVLTGVIALSSLTVARLGLLAERSARAERERGLAFQAAELALMDAEQDIESQANPLLRRQFFDDPASSGVSGCSAAADLGGLCFSPAGNLAWLQTDLAAAASSLLTPFGKRSGRNMPALFANAALPAPRYLVEALPFTPPGYAADTGKPDWLYRITAVGFGDGAERQVVLQSLYRRSPP